MTQPRKRHTPEEIVQKLERADQLLDQGAMVVDVCRVLDISQQTYYRWRRKYGDMSSNAAQEIEELEKQNARLERKLAEIELEKAVLRDLAEGNF